MTALSEWVYRHGLDRRFEGEYGIAQRKPHLGEAIKRPNQLALQSYALGFRSLSAHSPLTTDKGRLASPGGLPRRLLLV